MLVSLIRLLLLAGTVRNTLRKFGFVADTDYVPVRYELSLKRELSFEHRKLLNVKAAWKPLSDMECNSPRLRSFDYDLLYICC